MKDIESITEHIERMYVAGVTHTCIPVHSDIPFEDQMLVFEEAREEVKIIIATNAAESSITLPDCDHVICTGLQKQITYNASSHRQMLTACWISRASAKQRSGRVGRVRPGTVVSRALTLLPLLFFNAARIRSNAIETPVSFIHKRGLRKHDERV